MGLMHALGICLRRHGEVGAEGGIHGEIVAQVGPPERILHHLLDCVTVVGKALRRFKEEEWG